MARIAKAIQRPNLDESDADARARRDGTDLRCLGLVIGVLERVNGVCSHFPASRVSELIFITTDIRGKQHFRRRSPRAYFASCQA
jgi:hypothetical protein